MKAKMKIKNGNTVTVFDLEGMIEMEPDKEYKMLEILVKKEPTIIFGETNVYHCEILEAYLINLGIPFKYVSLPATDTPGPDKSGPDYSVEGGGRAKVSKDGIVMFGKSIGYDVFPRVSFLDTCSSAIRQGIEEIRAVYKESVQNILQATEIKNDVPTEVIDDIPMLEEKLELLHMCLVPSGFEDADGIVEKLKANAPKYGQNQISKINLMANEYVVLKELGKSGNAFDKDYISKLTQIRDILLE
jgi:hypothetical protein